MALDFSNTPPGTQSAGANTVGLDKIAETGSSLATGMNKAAADMFGVDALYFRSIPNKNAEDVIFMNYTLYNVDDCPKNIKVMFQDANYLAGDYTITLYEMNYNVPVQIQIDVKTWAEAYGSGTMPQRFDILYIPFLHKIYEVDSTNQVFGFMEQLTHYNVVLKKYNPKEFRKETESLASTIDSYTTSIEEIFGDALESEIADITDTNELDEFNSTPLDDYKFFSQKRVRVLDEYDRTFYRFSPIQQEHSNAKVPYSVEYKTGLNINFSENSLLFTNLFRYKSSESGVTIPVSKVELGSRFMDPNIGKVPYQEIILSCSTTQIPESVQYNDKIVTPIGILYFKKQESDKVICMLRYVDYLNIEDQLNKITSIQLKSNNYQSLLSGANKESSAFDFNILVQSNNLLNIVLKEHTYNIELSKNLKDDSWYGIGILITKKNIKVFLYSLNFGNVISGLRKFDSVIIDNNIVEDLNVESLGLVGSIIDQSTIRLYKLPIEIGDTLKDKEIKLEFTSDYSKNNSYSIINDNCLLVANKKNNIYVGKHK